MACRQQHVTDVIRVDINTADRKVALSIKALAHEGSIGFDIGNREDDVADYLWSSA